MLITPALAYRENSIIGVACGDGAVFVLMDDGKLIAWGDNGSGLIPSQSSRSKIKFDNRSLITANAKSVIVGSKCAFLINSSNELYGWGEDGDASLLCGSVYGNTVSEPVKLLDGIQCVSCGDEHNAAITTDGRLLVWGRDNNGSLGLDISSGSIVRQPQTVLESVTSVCCLGNNTVAVTTDGSLYAWGEDFGYYVPHKFSAGIVNVKKSCDKTFLLQNKNNEILLMQCIVFEDGTPAVHMTAPVASNISEITDFGYIRDDGTLWMCQSPTSNTFIPTAKQVSLVQCSDMRHLAYVSLHTLHIENYEFSEFKKDKTYPITDIDVPITPALGGIFGAIFLSLILAAAAFIVIEKPPFYLRLIEQIKEQFEKTDNSQIQ